MALVALSARSEQTTVIDGVAFRWMPLTKRQTAECAQYADEGEVAQGLRVWRMSVVGWELKDAQGNPVAWSDDPDENADRLPWDALMTVVTDILSCTRVDESQAGN